MDGENVQAGAASEGAASKEGESSQPQAPTFTPEQEAAITKRIMDEATKAAEALSRKFQSEKDRAIAKANREVSESRRRAEEAERLHAVTAQHLASLDPDAAMRLKLATYEERERFDATRQQQEAAERGKAEFDERFRKSYEDEIAEAGIDAKDVDWATDLDDPLERKSRINRSIIKAMKTRGELNVRALKGELKKEIADELKRDLGVNSVSTEAQTTARKGRKPSLDELRGTPASEAVKKFQSGEWAER